MFTLHSIGMNSSRCTQIVTQPFLAHYRLVVGGAKLLWKKQTTPLSGSRGAYMALFAVGLIYFHRVRRTREGGTCEGSAISGHTSQQVGTTGKNLNKENGPGTPLNIDH